MGEEAASAAIEFAIAAPLLFLMIFGDIEYCLIMCASSRLEGAVLAAAREGATGYVPNGQTQSAYLSSIIQTRAGNLMKTGGNRLTINIPGNSNTAGVVSTYTATYLWPLPMRWLSKIIGDSNGNYTISASAVVLNEPH